MEPGAEKHVKSSVFGFLRLDEWCCVARCMVEPGTGARAIQYDVFGHSTAF